MRNENRSRVWGGIFLVILGGIFLFLQNIPNYIHYYDYFQGWPVAVIAVGIILFIFGLLSNSPGMAVPACLVSGIGGILLYQNNSGDWESWSYMWALIPGFVGLGVILTGILEGRFRSEASNGFWLLCISAFLFVIFGALLGGIDAFTQYWPAVLIILGLWIIVRSIIRR